MVKTTSHTAPPPRRDEPDLSAGAAPAAVDMRAVNVEMLPKTTGERGYDWLQFLLGKAFIMAFTAGIAYVARYGKESYGGVPNYLKKFQDWFNHKLLHNEVLPLKRMGEAGERLAGAIASTTTLCHGGNLFAPVMKWVENNRSSIVHYLNERYGKKGEVEIGDVRTKDTPQQTWGDIIKGRLAGWGLVFLSFASLDILTGKDKRTGMYRFDQYEEWFGRKLAGFTKAGEAMGKMPLTEALTEAQKTNTTYRLGKIIALDVYATSAVIALWNTVSRMSARSRAAQEQENAVAAAAMSHLPASPPEESEKTTASLRDIKPKLAGGYVDLAQSSSAMGVGVGLS